MLCKNICARRKGPLSKVRVTKRLLAHNPSEADPERIKQGFANLPENLPQMEHRGFSNYLPGGTSLPRWILARHLNSTLYRAIYPVQQPRRDLLQVFKLPKHLSPFHFVILYPSQTDSFSHPTLPPRLRLFKVIIWGSVAIYLALRHIQHHGALRSPQEP